jgi:O-antigen/teichoic acid export membrane protein
LATSYGLRSTGLLVFGGRIFSAFTGLAFNVMIAGWLSPSGFGTWEVIVTLVTFSAYPVGVVGYWATREVARGSMVGRTALIVGGLLSFMGLALYFGFTSVTYSRIASPVAPFLVGALLVPLSYWSGTSNSLVQGYRPGAYSYALVISEVAKLCVAYEVLYVLKLGIEGVILALSVAYLVQAAVGTYLVRPTVSERFDGSQARRWSRLAWLPAVSYLPGVIAVADTFVAAVGFGTTNVGYYQVAFTIASVVGYSTFLAFSLYPLLLRGGNERLPGLSIEFSLLFALPMAVGCVVLAGPIMLLFGGRYLPGVTGLEILGVTFVFTTVSSILDQTLLGIERVDLADKPGFRALARSNLLFVPMVNIAYGVSYVAGLYLALSYASSQGYSPSSTVALWAAVQFVSTVAFMLVKVRRAGRHAKLVPGRSVLWYLVASAAMGAVVSLSSGTVAPQTAGTLAYGSRLLVLGVLGAAVYFGVLFVVDAKFRGMARSLLQKI